MEHSWLDILTQATTAAMVQLPIACVAELVGFDVNGA
jgi:hypothetical protein